MKKIISYELNEVSWKVIDFYINNRTKSNLEKILKSSHQFTTYTRDTEELHPWSTWPTMHRGVYNDFHDIRFINQDLSSSSKYPPVWDFLIKSGFSVGIFGSLQSGGANYSKNYKFHIPDTFYKDSKTNPKKYERFQKFNHDQTKKNRAISSTITILDALKTFGLFSNGLSVLSSYKIFKHLILEKNDINNKSLRPMLQAYISFDVFKDCMKNNKPDFVTFFTNHVAGIMHRYWKYSFPEDFDGNLNNNKLYSFHKDSILKAMDIVDDHFGFLFNFSKQNNYDLIVSSSMGQEAIDRGEYIPEIKIDNFDKFKTKIKFLNFVKMNMAMQPDVAFEFSNNDDLKKFKKVLLSLTDSDKNYIFKSEYNSKKLTLNLKLLRSKILAEDKKIIYNNKPFQIDDFGLTIFNRDIGTGYHQPYGIIIWNNDQEFKQQDRRQVDTCDFAPTLLDHYNLDYPDYMGDIIWSKK